MKEVLMKRLFVFVLVLAGLFAFSIYIPSLSFARGGGGSDSRGNHMFGEQNTYRVEKKSTFKNSHRNREREARGKKKGELNRATPAKPAERAIPTPGTPGADKAVRAIPAVPAKK